jgi:hypothetical protein
MEGATEEAKASSPMESVRNINGGRNMLSGTDTLRRQAPAKRTEPWHLALPPPQLRTATSNTGHIWPQFPWYLAPPPPPHFQIGATSTGHIGLQFPWYLASLLPPPQQPPQQAEYIPARKKRRLETPIATVTAEAATKIASPDVAIAAAAAADANTDSVADTQLSPRATGRTRRGWAPKVDAELTSAVANTRKTNWGKECKRDWAAIAALVALDPSVVERTPGRTGKWTAVEDSQLKDTVQTHGSKNWTAIAALVPGQTQLQCRYRWKYVLDPNIDRVPGIIGKWTADEDSKLKDAVQTHGGKNWGAIAVLVPGRTKVQCYNRLKNTLDPPMDRSPRRKGTWTPDEDSKLINAAQTYGARNWDKIAVLVPGREGSQCRHRWNDIFNPSIDRAPGRKGSWAADEDSRLKDALQMYGAKNWDKIAVLVRGRTQKQCYNRWHDALDPSIGLAPGRSGKEWTEDEDLKLRHAVQMHGGKKWDAIAALVPGRAKRQCQNRWHAFLKLVPLTHDELMARNTSTNSTIDGG